MTTRTVTGVIRHTDGSVWPNYGIAFIRAPGSYTADDTYPPDTVRVSTDANGQFEVDLWVNDEGFAPSRYICQLKGEEFMFPLQPGDPIDLPQLRGLSPGGVAIADEALIAWVAGQMYELLTITYDVTLTDVISSATVKWPDGSTGVWTSTNLSAGHHAINAFTITHTNSGKTVTQPAVTRNANGDITVKPAMTISP